MKQKLREKLTYANVVSTLCLFVVLGGSAYAAFKVKVPPNSVGTRQIKAKAVTGGKIANGAVNAAKLAEGSITGADINMGLLGTVPKAAEASKAQLAATLGTEAEPHSAACPPNTTLIRGACFDSRPNEPANSLKEAIDDCAAKGGWLPTPGELYSIRQVLNLGTGVGADHQYSDAIYSSPGHGEYRTIVVDGKGTMSEWEINVPSKYTCVYPLVR